MLNSTTYTNATQRAGKYGPVPCGYIISLSNQPYFRIYLHFTQYTMSNAELLRLWIAEGERPAVVVFVLANPSGTLSTTPLFLEFYEI